MRILLGGMVARDAGQGGAAWAVLQYALGLRRLGHEVRLAEPVAAPSAETRAYLDAVARRFGVEAELVAERRRFDGFDLVLNISGLLPLEAIEPIPVRVWLDLDPAFNQLWHADGIDMRFDGHTHFVTVGQAIGRDGCDVPTLGLEWIPTVPPVVLEEWPPADGVERDALTTVANFRGYGSVERDGVRYGQKVHSLRRLLGLPRRTRERFVLAMDVHPDERADLEALAENGWELVDPLGAAGTPDRYRRFVQGSRAEIGIAKSGYVLSRCGWFSDRSACYLASGRPVVAQETGFSRFLPAGEGLLAFEDEDGAVEAIDRLRADYPRHARAARALAEEHLDSDRVLGRLLERVGG